MTVEGSPGAQGHDLDTVELNYPIFISRTDAAPAQHFQRLRRRLPGLRRYFHESWLGRGWPPGDIDNDGRVDAVVTTNDGPVYVLRNETLTQNHWLTLKLVGHQEQS